MASNLFRPPLSPLSTKPPIYCQISNIRCTLVGNEIVEHSDVVGASPVGAAPTTSSFWTQHLASMDWVKTTARRDEKRLNFGIWCVLYLIFEGISLRTNPSNFLFPASPAPEFVLSLHSAKAVIAQPKTVPPTTLADAIIQLALLRGQRHEVSDPHPTLTD